MEISAVFASNEPAPPKIPVSSSCVTLQSSSNKYQADSIEAKKILKQNLAECLKVQNEYSTNEGRNPKTNHQGHSVHIAYGCIISNLFKHPIPLNRVRKACQYGGPGSYA